MMPMNELPTSPHGFPRRRAHQCNIYRLHYLISPLITGRGMADDDCRATLIARDDSAAHRGGALSILCLCLPIARRPHDALAGRTGYACDMSFATLPRPPLSARRRQILSNAVR